MQKKTVIIFLGIILISIISGSVSFIMDLYLPLPSINAIYGAGVLLYPALFCRIVTVIIIYLLSKKFWASFTLTARIFLFAFLIMELAEGIFNNWQPQTLLLSNVLNLVFVYLSYLSVSFILCYFPDGARKTQYSVLLYFGLALIATMVFIFIRVETSPAGAGIATVANTKDLLFLNFIPNFELAVISLITLYSLELSENISSKTLVKGIILTSLIIFTRVDFPLQDMLHSEGNFFYRIFYFGQSIWTYSILGLLTAYFYTQIKR